MNMKDVYYRFNLNIEIEGVVNVDDETYENLILDADRFLEEEDSDAVLDALDLLGALHYNLKQTIEPIDMAIWTEEDMDI